MPHFTFAIYPKVLLILEFSCSLWYKLKKLHHWPNDPSARHQVKHLHVFLLKTLPGTKGIKNEGDQRRGGSKTRGSKTRGIKDEGIKDEEGQEKGNW